MNNTLKLLQALEKQHAVMGEQIASLRLAIGQLDEMPLVVADSVLSILSIDAGREIHVDVNDIPGFAPHKRLFADGAIWIKDSEFQSYGEIVAHVFKNSSTEYKLFVWL